MENIGRLVNALEDQHRQRRFDVMWPGGAKGSAGADPQRSEDRSRVSNKGVGGSTGTFDSCTMHSDADCIPF
jgi:hypothetical protein